MTSCPTLPHPPIIIYYQINIYLSQLVLKIKIIIKHIISRRDCGANRRCWWFDSYRSCSSGIIKSRKSQKLIKASFEMIRQRNQVTGLKIMTKQHREVGVVFGRDIANHLLERYWIINDTQTLLSSCRSSIHVGVVVEMFSFHGAHNKPFILKTLRPTYGDAERRVNNTVNRSGRACNNHKIGRASCRERVLNLV